MKGYVLKPLTHSKDSTNFVLTVNDCCVSDNEINAIKQSLEQRFLLGDAMQCNLHLEIHSVR